MPFCATRYFGTTEYSDDAVLEFENGLPGFEQERRFVAIDQASTRPLVYLQSLSDPQLCFVALPLRCVDSEYTLELPPEERLALGLSVDGPAELGPELLGLALVSVAEDGTTANLMAPVVALLRTRRAIQSFSGVGRYSHRHPLVEQEAAC